MSSLKTLPSLPESSCQASPSSSKEGAINGAINGLSGIRRALAPLQARRVSQENCLCSPSTRTDLGESSPGRSPPRRTQPSPGWSTRRQGWERRRTQKPEGFAVPERGEGHVHSLPRPG